MEYCSATTKNEVMPFAAIWMDPEIVILSEVRRRRKNIVQHPLYVESKRNDTKELPYKIERDRLRECIYGFWEKVIVREFRMDVFTLLNLKWVTIKDLLYSTGNSAQC